ncbi:MAG: hypothetical protein JO251_06515 [Verrucomicrobia bacterium]|nr:hypothetical protein [Verrucomicrobiota bacterium]
MRVDVGHKGLSWFRYPVGQWDIEGVSPCDGETVKAYQHFMFALPESRHGSFAPQVSVDPIALDFCHRDVAHRSAKCFEGAFFCAEAHTHRPFVGDVFAHHLR